MKILSDILVKAGLVVEGATNLQGTATTITQSNSDNSTKIATTAFVKNQGYLNGSGTANYLVKWTGGAAVSNSLIYDDGNGVIVGGTVNAGYKFDVSGTTRLGGDVALGALANLYTTNQFYGLTTNFTNSIFVGWDNSAVYLGYNMGNLFVDIGTNVTNQVRFRNTGGVKIESLAGDTTRMLVVNSAGLINAQAIPSLTGYVPTSRIITINGTAYDLSADRAWTVSANQNARTEYEFTTNGSTATYSAVYSVGQVDVFYNGSKLSSTEFTASNGTSVTLGFTPPSGQLVEVVAWETGGGVTNGRTLTINGVAFDLSANRSWTIDNASLGAQAQLNGTGFVKISGTTISYDNSTYLTTASAASTYLTTSAASSTYLPLAGGTLTGALSGTSATFSSTITATRFISNVTNGYGLVLNRALVSNYNGISLQTAGIAQWYVGMRENLSSNDYVIYNESGYDNLKLSKSTGTATFSGTGSQAIRITSSFGLSSGYADAFQMLFANQTGGGLSLNIGKSESSRNLAKMVYTHVADGSTSNRLGFGFYDADGLLNILASGSIGIGTATPGAYILALDYNASAAAVMSIKNSSASGYSGVHILNNSGSVMGHWGYANASAGGVLNDAVYFGSTASKSVIFTTADIERTRLTTLGNFTFNGTNVPSGLVQEVSGNTPLLGLDVNFRPSSLVNTSFAGGQVRVDMRSGQPPFSFLYRPAGSTTDSVLATVREDGIRLKNGGTSLGYYEEGSWTPVLNNASVSYSDRSGSYVRIGNYVFIRWGFRISSISGQSGVVQISGLPFSTAGYGSYQEPNVSVSTGLLANSDYSQRARVYVSGTSLFGRIANNGDTTWDTSQLQNGSWIIGEIFYNIS